MLYGYDDNQDFLVNPKKKSLKNLCKMQHTVVLQSIEHQKKEYLLNGSTFRQRPTSTSKSGNVRDFVCILKELS